MFKVCGRTIQVSQGDTGVLHFDVEDMPLGKRDRAVFTVKKRTGGVIMRKIAAPEGNVFRIPFVNADTQSWKPDTYEWDLRIVLDPVYGAGGDVTDGREVITPFPPGALMVMKVVGSV